MSKFPADAPNRKVMKALERLTYPSKNIKG